jgi:hypothetical protein
MSTLTHASILNTAARGGRAASLKQVLNQRMSRMLGRIWSALETMGRRRAAPELLRQARLHESTNPALAAALRQVAQPRRASYRARADIPARAA